ncbi:hypothetical protein [Sphingobium chungangianum]
MKIFVVAIAMLVSPPASAQVECTVPNYRTALGWFSEAIIRMKESASGFAAQRRSDLLDDLGATEQRISSLKNNTLSPSKADMLVTLMDIEVLVSRHALALTTMTAQDFPDRANARGLTLLLGLDSPYVRTKAFAAGCQAAINGVLKFGK